MYEDAVQKLKTDLEMRMTKVSRLMKDEVERCVDHGSCI